MNHPLLGGTLTLTEGGQMVQVIRFGREVYWCMFSITVTTEQMTQRKHVRWEQDSPKDRTLFWIEAKKQTWLLKQTLKYIFLKEEWNLFIAVPEMPQAPPPFHDVPRSRGDKVVWPWTTAKCSQDCHTELRHESCTFKGPRCAVWYPIKEKGITHHILTSTNLIFNHHFLSLYTKVCV